MSLAVFEEYMIVLGRWGACLAYVLAVVAMVMGDRGWALFFVGLGSGLLGLTLSAADRRR